MMIIILRLSPLFITGILLLLLLFACNIAPFPSVPPRSVAFSKPEKVKFAEVRLVVSPVLRKILRLNSRERIRRLILPTEALRVSRMSSGGGLIDRAVRQVLPVGNLPCVVCIRERRTTTSRDGASLPPFKTSGSDVAVVNSNFYVFVDIDPEHGGAPAPPKWLQDLPHFSLSKPEAIQKWNILSFYRFFEVEDPKSFAEMLHALWRPLRVLGRIYVAKEGVNAQMAVQENVLGHFRLATDSVPGLRGVFFNLDRSNGFQRGVVVVDNNKQCSISEEENNCGRPSLPFKNLHVRARQQIVADGFRPDEEQQLDSTVPIGKGLTPSEWHDMVDRDDVIVLDCRNAYESAIGRFSSAVPLNTTYFRDTWDALPVSLAGISQDAPILTYCTGGIRCEKVAAYLVQNLGYTNVMRLEGGIVSYASHCKESQLRSKFLGLNYVFDGRMAERITNDSLAYCEMCGSPVDSHVNCANVRCHTRFLQCHRCTVVNQGCCSQGCKRQKEFISSSALNGDCLPWLNPGPFQNSYLNRVFDHLIAEASTTHLPDCQRVPQVLKGLVIRLVKGGNKILHINAGGSSEADVIHQEAVLKEAVLDFASAEDVVAHNGCVITSERMEQHSYQMIHVEHSGRSRAKILNLFLFLAQKNEFSVLSRGGLISLSLDDSDVLKHCMFELSKGWWKNNFERASLDISKDRLLMFVRRKGE